jgi:hypothetical protein
MVLKRVKPYKKIQFGGKNSLNRQDKSSNYNDLLHEAIELENSTYDFHVKSFEILEEVYPE